MVSEVEFCPPEPNELAPSHPGFDGEIDEGPVAYLMRLCEVDGLSPGEKDHLARGDSWWIYPLEGIDKKLLLLHGNLQHAAKGSVVTVYRARRDPCFDLVIQPVLDLIRGESSDPVRAKAGEDSSSNSALGQATFSDPQHGQLIIKAWPRQSEDTRQLSLENEDLNR